MVKLYSFNDVKMRVSCIDYLASQGIRVGQDGRCAATWRGGDGKNVSVEASKWYDHVTKRGGSVIDLCATVQFGGDLTRACSWLGEHFNLEPRTTTKARHRKTRAEFLLESGYRNTATYHYTDEHGETVYSVMRFEKDEYGPGEKKEFVQCTPLHEGLGDDTPRLPYNLPSVIGSDEVCIVEGEKDVETLRRFGFVGTTNSGGATNWDKGLTKWFAGKDVVILPDNDEPGRKHGDLLVNLLVPVARSVKVVVVSSLPKGDVTDWIEKEGGDGAKLREMISSTRVANATKSPDVAKAKAANESPFRNYFETQNGRGTRSVPVSIVDLVDECYTRFLGYPRKLGSTLFDWLRDDERIQYIENANALVAWMGSVSKHPVDWMTGQGFVTKEVFFEALLQRAKAYVSVSSAPHYPLRSDVYYTCGALPPADITHSSWKKLLSFFNPCDRANGILLSAFLAAPLFYSQHADRPLWIIDTEDQQGSGKTSLVKLCALLYGSEYMGVNISQLEKDPDKVYRRFLSSEARRKRVALFDNITREIRSEALATLVTESYITGVAPYGRGEESRPNDMTYVITVNNANVNADIASRAYTVRIAKVANPDPMWFDTVAKYISDNRMQILADLIDKIVNNKLRSVKRRQSRFGMFDSVILTAMCESEDEVAMADSAISSSNDTSNTDMDHGQEFADLFRERMLKADSAEMALKRANRTATAQEIETCVDYGRPIFVTNADVDWMLMRSDGALRTWKSRDIFGLIRNGHVPGFDRKTQRINNEFTCFDGVTPIPKYRGFLYVAQCMDERVSAQVIRRVNGSSFEVIGIAKFTVQPPRGIVGDGMKDPGWNVQVGISGESRPTMSLKDRMLAATRDRKAQTDEPAVGETFEMSDEDAFNALI